MKTLLSRAVDELKGQAVNITIEEFVEELELLKWERGIENFSITESSKNETKNFEVENLQIEVEGDVVVCGDAKDVINANNSVLIAFLESSVAVYKTYTTDKTCYELDFIDGQVLIETI